VSPPDLPALNLPGFENLEGLTQKNRSNRVTFYPFFGLRVNRPMNDTRPLQYGQFYHIYNRGINGCCLFKENDNYKHFLGLYDKYISPIANTFAWCLMKNHFHFLIRVKNEDEVEPLPKTFQRTPDLPGSTIPGRSKRMPTWKV